MARARRMGVALVLIGVLASCRGGSDVDAVVASTTVVASTSTSVVVDPAKPQTATGANGNPRDDRIGPPANNRPADPALVEGACFDEYLVAAGEVLVHQVQVLDCQGPHDGEVFAVLPLDVPASAPFPGETAVGQQSSGLCLERFQPFVGLEYATSTLRIAVMRPTAGTWARPDRTVVCSIYDQDLRPLTGSVRNTAR